MHERDVISDEAWAVIEPLLPQVQGRSRPWLDHRMVVEGIAWRFRTGSPWRDLPERFGPWNTVFKRFDRWAKDGTWQNILTAAQQIHLVADGRGRPLSMVLTPGNVNDTTMLADTIERIRVPKPGLGRPRTRPDRVLADKGYPSRANRAYLASRGIKSTIPDRVDQKQNRANKGSSGGRPTEFDAEIYKGRNLVERSFNRLKNWRGIAMRSDKTARNYQAGITLAATLIWINTDLFNTALCRAPEILWLSCRMRYAKDWTPED